MWEAGRASPDGTDRAQSRSEQTLWETAWSLLQRVVKRREL